MDNVINIDDYRKTGNGDETFTERTERIRQSLDKINQLMRDLKVKQEQNHDD